MGPVVQEALPGGLVAEQSVQGAGLFRHRGGQVHGQGCPGLADRLAQAQGGLAGGRGQADLQRRGRGGREQGQDARHGVGLAGSRAAGEDHQPFDQGQGRGGLLPVDLPGGRGGKEPGEQFPGRFDRSVQQADSPRVQGVGDGLLGAEEAQQVEPVVPVEDERPPVAGTADRVGGEQAPAQPGRIAVDPLPGRSRLPEQGGQDGQGQTGVPLSACPAGKSCCCPQFRAVGAAQAGHQPAGLDIDGTQGGLTGELSEQVHHCASRPRQQLSRAMISPSSGRAWYTPVPAGCSGCMARRKR